MNFNVVVTPQAESQIRTIDKCWTDNRPAAPALFVEELSVAFDVLARAPLVGRSYPHPIVRGVRRLLPRATRFHVYCQLRERGVVVLVVWHSSRGAGPDLAALAQSDSVLRSPED